MTPALFLSIIPAVALIAWIVWKFGPAPIGLNIVDLAGKLPTAAGKSYKNRSVQDIRRVVFHHSATVSGSPEGFARYHVEQHGWPGIGYHFVIGQDGTVYRCNPDDKISYHCSGQNGHSIGVCLVGNFELSPPTPAQLKSASGLMRVITAKYEWVDKTPYGHKDFSSTNCPGRYFDYSAL